MSLDIEITIGGLCLFVQRDDSVKGLFVLMPAFPDHLPFASYDGIYTGESGSEIIYPIQQVVSLTGFLTGGKRRQLSVSAAPVSEILSDNRIANHWTEDQLLVNPLLARVDFDLGWDVTAVDGLSPIDVHAFYKKKGETFPWTHHHLATGTAKITVQNVPEDTKILIGTKTFQKPNPKDRSKPPINNIRFALLNINPNELHRPDRKDYPAGTLIPHFAAYYNLVAGCKMNCKGPDLKLTNKVTVGPYHPHFVDPVTCMVAGGRSEQESS